MKRKLVSIFVCMFLIVSVIGCGANNTNNKNEKEQQTNSNATKTTEPTKEAEPGTSVTATPVATAAATPTEVAATPNPTIAPAVVVSAPPSVKPADIKLGSSWKQMHTQEYKKNKYFAAGYNNKDNGLTVGYAGAVYYTENAGEKWSGAGNFSACRFGLDYANDKIIYTCGNKGDVTKSTNGGVTFNKVTSFGDSEPNQCRSLSFCDENNGIIASRERLAITNDGAETWKELDPPSDIVAIRMVAPDTFYIVDTEYSIFKTVDGGSTWEVTPMNLPEGKDYLNEGNNFALFVDADNAYTVFCVQRSTRELKSYSTIDNWGTCKENKVPKLTGVLTFYGNREGNLVTITNLHENTITVLGKK